MFIHVFFFIFFFSDKNVFQIQIENTKNKKKKFFSMLIWLVSVVSVDVCVCAYETYIQIILHFKVCMKNGLKKKRTNTQTKNSNLCHPSLLDI